MQEMSRISSNRFENSLIKSDIFLKDASVFTHSALWNNDIPCLRFTFSSF